MGTLPIIPWRVKHFVSCAINALHYGYARAKNCSAGHQLTGLRIHFEIPEYGITGGALAMINIANLLSANHTVSFQRTPTSERNRYLKPSVLVTQENSTDIDCCIIESGISPTRLAEFKKANIPIVVSNHGYPANETTSIKGYGYTNLTIQTAFSTADALQFVSMAQRNEFFKLGWINSPDYIVQNYVEQVARDSAPTNNCGIVCDTTLPLKNAITAIKAGNASDALTVQVWGKYASRYPDTKVRMNGYCTDKSKIYGSFDVLILLSYTEVQPLCVLEAISCGIPCVLSDIPCYQEFRGIPGFFFTPPDDIPAATHAINTALSQKAQLRDGLISLWRERYAPDAVSALWEATLQEMATSRKPDHKQGLLDA